MKAKERASRILDLCLKHYGSIPGFLEYRTPFELLVSVILSAQTTDDQVNKVTPHLFEQYPDAHRLARAEIEHIEELIRSTGYYRNKAKNIVGAARHLVQYHEGGVPDTMDDLVRVPGVGRKSAGVVLFHVWGKPAIIVDTHFGRVSRRLGLSTQEDPVKLEADLAALYSPEYWGNCSMLLNLHGRRICTARSPRCADCFLLNLCPSAIITPT